MTIIEVEDTKGNTLMSFRINITKKENIIDMLKNCNIADCDDDYIFNTNEPLIRVQQEND